MASTARDVPFIPIGWRLPQVTEVEPGLTCLYVAHRAVNRALNPQLYGRKIIVIARKEEDIEGVSETWVFFCGVFIKIQAGLPLLDFTGQRNSHVQPHIWIPINQGEWRQ